MSTTSGYRQPDSDEYSVGLIARSQRLQIRMEDIEEVKAKFVGAQFEDKVFEVEADSIVGFSKACGETSPRFIDPSHPDFQAPPTFASCFARGRNMPKDFPTFGGVAFDGGKDVQPHAPIRPGVPLVGRSHVHDVYAKSGRSGRMVFVVTRMELSTKDGTPVATADTRLAIREKIES